MKITKVQVFRALAIIAVVMIHTTPEGVCQIYIKPFINFAVATFLFLSGYLTSAKSDNWMMFYRKRIIRVLIPYLVWTIIYSFSDFQSIGLVGIGKNLLSANATTPLYYIFVYIQFVLLTPLLCRLARSQYRYIGWLIAPISVLLFKYMPSFGYLTIDKHIQLFWSDSCLGWFTFYYLGLILGNKIIDRRFKLSNLLLLYCISVLLQIGEGYVWCMCGMVGCGSQLKLTAILSSSIFMLIIYNILENDNYKMQCRTMEIIGDFSFGIYLSHMMILTTIDEFSFYKDVPYPMSSLIVLIFSLAFCCLCTLIIGKKAGRWLGFV